MGKLPTGIVVLFFLLAGCVSRAGAKTLVLEGGLESVIAMTQQVQFTVEKPLSSHSFRFALPTSCDNRAVSQKTEELTFRYSPRPDGEEDEVDRFGNRFHKVTWKDLSTDVRITIQYLVRIRVGLSAMESSAPFPLSNVPETEKVFLSATAEVQSGDSELREIARNLTAGYATEYEAVTAILTHVADTIKYSYNPPHYDALSTLRAGSGNCQNLAHYSLALLRAAGIPARIVGGISLAEPWQVTMENGQSWVQRMGQGGHAWIEIYFPDLGWLSYDPLYSRQFTPTRHVKQTHGLDANDVNDSWRSVPSLPRYGETVTAEFRGDRVAVRVASSLPAPRPYLLSNRIVSRQVAAAPPVVPPHPPIVVSPPSPGTAPAVPVPSLPVPSPPKPQVPPATGPKVKPPVPALMELGNMEFPTLVDAYRTVGNEGHKILDKETSEYVTSRQIYAQAFTTPAPLRLEKVSLAMRKFGGDGTLYVDVVADDNGRPGMEGLRSTPIFVETITRKPGYYWVDFTFPPDVNLALGRGKYWIVLRHSGEAIMNWFFTPGKPYSGSDDTRSTAKGYRWEDILNYDFVFKVTGIR